VTIKSILYEGAEKAALTLRIGSQASGLEIRGLEPISTAMRMESIVLPEMSSEENLGTAFAVSHSAGQG